MSGNVAIRCPGEHWGFAIGATGRYEVRCTARNCRTAEGCPVVHDFDLATGSFITTVAPIVRAETPPEDEHHGRQPTL